MESLATGLRCIDCETTLPLGYTLQCPRCSGLLELLYDADKLQKKGSSIFTGAASGATRPCSPSSIPPTASRWARGRRRSSTAPGSATAPRRAAPRRQVRGREPHGHVKDRTSATAIGAALQFGFRVTSVVSSGNAGSSIGAYSARAGLRSLVFCYERASAPKMLHMAATAHDLVIYQGVYDDLIALWDALADERLFFDCGASRNPYKHEGKKTIAYEIAEQLGWRAPDVVVAPIAVGETFIAAHRGFAEMERLGFIPRRPIMAAAQAARANTVAKAWRDKTALAPSRSATPSPRDWPRAIPAARATGSCAFCARQTEWRVRPRTRRS